MTPLQTYRYPVNGWWTVVLAKDIADALHLVGRSINETKAELLEVWNGKQYEKAMP